MRLQRQSLPKNAPFSKVALGGSEQRFGIQKTATGVAPVLLIVVHLTTPAGVHALDNLVIRNAGLTACDCGNFFGNGTDKPLGEIDAGVIHCLFFGDTKGEPKCFVVTISSV